MLNFVMFWWLIRINNYGRTWWHMIHIYDEIFYWISSFCVVSYLVTLYVENFRSWECVMMASFIMCARSAPFITGCGRTVPFVWMVPAVVLPITNKGGRYAFIVGASELVSTIDSLKSAKKVRCKQVCNKITRIQYDQESQSVCSVDIR